MAQLSLEEIHEYTHECVERAALLTDVENAVVQGLALQLQEGTPITPYQSARLRQIYYALKAREYG
jgi:hypothetical protein